MQLESEGRRRGIDCVVSEVLRLSMEDGLALVSPDLDWQIQSGTLSRFLYLVGLKTEFSPVCIQMPSKSLTRVPKMLGSLFLSFVAQGRTQAGTFGPQDGHLNQAFRRSSERPYSFYRAPLPLLWPLSGGPGFLLKIPTSGA